NTDHFYTDSYTQELNLHDQLRYMVLEGELSIPFDYAKYPNSRYLPECLSAGIQTEEQGIVWVDAHTGKLGIGNKHHSQIVNLNDISGLLLRGMYWRDEPRELTIHFLTNNQKGLVADPDNYLGALDTNNDDNA